MSKQVFLHIGGEKTGTTTLQHFLSRNASRLAGYYYPCEPDNICFENSAHFPVAACLIGEKTDFVSEERQQSLPFVLRALAQVVSSSKQSILLSCEHFSSRVTDMRKIEKLRDSLPADEIKVIYYIREPSDLALAAWSTNVSSGGKLAFNIDAITPENRYYNHLETLNLWCSVFGAQNLIVREYNRSSLTEGDICKDFCAVLGIQTTLMEFEGNKNQSLDAQRLQVLRYINCVLAQFHESDIEWRKAQNLRRQVLSHIPPGGPLTMSEKERTLIKSRFAVVNREISQRYFGGQLSRDWFPDCVAPEETGPQDSCHQDIAAILRATIISLANANCDCQFRLRDMPPKKKRPIKELFKRLEHRFFPAVSETTVQQ